MTAAVLILAGLVGFAGLECRVVIVPGDQSIHAAQQNAVGKIVGDGGSRKNQAEDGRIAGDHAEIICHDHGVAAAVRQLGVLDGEACVGGVGNVRAVEPPLIGQWLAARRSHANGERTARRHGAADRVGDDCGRPADLRGQGELGSVVRGVRGGGGDELIGWNRDWKCGGKFSMTGRIGLDSDRSEEGFAFTESGGVVGGVEKEIDLEDTVRCSVERSGDDGRFARQLC